MTNLRVLPSKTEPVDSVVTTLREMLELAERGEMRGLVIAYETTEHLGHRVAWGPGACSAALVGEMEIAKLDLFVVSGRLKTP